MKVQFVAEGEAAQVRILPLLPFLQAQNIECSVRTPPRGGWLSSARFASEADLVYWQNRLPSKMFVRRLSRSARAWIFEIDRPLFLKGTALSRRRLARFAAMVEAADLVVAPNQYLAGYARKYTEEWRVKVLPTGIDLSRWPAKTQPRRQHKVILGWVGTRSDLRHLEMLEPTLSNLSEYFPQLELRVICDIPVAFRNMKVGCKRLIPKDLPEEVAAFDVALVPYVEDAWSMGQFPNELLMYLAAGLPIIASDSMNVRSILTDHSNGLLAGVPEEWEKKIGLLIEAPDLGIKLGEGARRTAEKIYSLERISKGYLSVFQAAIRESQASSKAENRAP